MNFIGITTMSNTRFEINIKSAKQINIIELSFEQTYFLASYLLNLAIQHVLCILLIVLLFVFNAKRRVYTHRNNLKDVFLLDFP